MGSPSIVDIVPPLFWERPPGVAEHARTSSQRCSGASPWDHELARGSCPAARATSHLLSRNPAGKTRSVFPLASQVSRSELLGAEATVSCPSVARRASRRRS